MIVDGRPIDQPCARAVERALAAHHVQILDAERDTEKRRCLARTASERAILAARVFERVFGEHVHERREPRVETFDALQVGGDELFGRQLQGAQETRLIDGRQGEKLAHQRRQDRVSVLLSTVLCHHSISLSVF